MSISERLKVLLFSQKKNVKQLAKEINVTQSALNKVARGEAMPSSKVLIPLAEIGVNINWLLVGAGEMMQEGHTISKDNNTIIQNSKLTNSNNTNTGDNTVVQTGEDSKTEALKIEVKSLKKEIKIIKASNQILQESKTVLEGSIATLENQIKDKEMIISLLQDK